MALEKAVGAGRRVNLLRLHLSVVCPVENEAGSLGRATTFACTEAEAARALCRAGIPRKSQGGRFKPKGAAARVQDTFMLIGGRTLVQAIRGRGDIIFSGP